MNCTFELTTTLSSCYSGIGRVNPNHASNDVYEVSFAKTLGLPVIDEARPLLLTGQHPSSLQLGGINHMTIFVSFNEDPQASDEKHLYLVDVGFGALGLVAPIPLRECIEGQAVKSLLSNRPAERLADECVSAAQTQTRLNLRVSTLCTGSACVPTPGPASLLSHPSSPRTREMHQIRWAWTSP